MAGKLKYGAMFASKLQEHPIVVLVLLVFVNVFNSG